MARSLRLLPLLALAACEPGFSVPLEYETTVAVDSDVARLHVDALIPVRVRGSRRDDLVLRIEGTVTASSTDTAQRAADAYTLEAKPRDEAGPLEIVMAPPSQGQIEGVLTVLMPRDLELLVLSRGGTADVSGMREGIEVQSAGGVLVADSSPVVLVRSEQGGVALDSNLAGGVTIDVDSARGDIQLALPSAPSVRILADAANGISSSHPSLPSRPAGVPYQQVLGGGSASVVLSARGGGIFFIQR